VLFFTRGVGLEHWQREGILERELALYRRLRPAVGRISFVTYGRGRDREIARTLPEFTVYHNRWNLPDEWHARLVAQGLARTWCQPMIFKSNQLPGADLPLRALGQASARYIARCGYLYTDFIERHYGKQSTEAQQFHDLEHRAFQRADQIVLTTEEMKRSVESRYAFAAGKVQVIPNYVDTELFRPRERKACAGLFSIVTVGRLEPQKNLVTLIEALAGQPIALTIVGSGPLRAELEQKAREVQATVQIVEPRPHAELADYLTQFNLFVLPSLYEGHPKVLIEAMAAGLPVLGTNVPGTRAVICHGENGWLCSPQADALREALQILRQQPELRMKLGHAARKFAVGEYSLDRVATLELALWEQLIR
jgi:glycosyltransferase involved in cell wall biosynthesis